MIKEPDLKPDGSFHVVSKGIGLAGRVEVLTGNLTDHRLMRHQYQAPFDRDRMGDLLEQRREPYIETRLRDKSFRVLTLFSLVSELNVPSEWVRGNESWRIRTKDGDCEVVLREKELRVVSDSGQSEWKVSL